METKRIAITGATSGIGKQAALELSKMGHEIIMFNRNPGKTEKTIAEIKKESGNDKFDFFHCDLAEFDSVMNAARKFNEKYDDLDVLINNAGLLAGNRHETPDGNELTLQVNHLSHFMLTKLLLDKLKNGGESRIINVSSDAHLRANKIPWDDFQLEKRYEKWYAYGLSKMYQIHFTYLLDEELDESNVKVFAMHPGFADTGFGNSSTKFWSWLLKLLKPFKISVEKGAETLVWLVYSDDDKIESGKYYYKNEKKMPSKQARNMVIAKRVWEISEELTGVSYNESK